MTATPGAGKRITVAGARALGALLALHTPLELAGGPMCRECLTAHPCRTVQLAHTIAGVPAPTQEGSP